MDLIYFVKNYQICPNSFLIQQEKPAISNGLCLETLQMHQYLRYFSNTEMQFCTLALAEGQSLKESLVWVWGLVLLLFTPKQTSFSFSLRPDPFDHHLHIGYKMENERLCNTSDFQSSVPLWRLPNKCLSSQKPAAGLYKRRTGQYPGLGNEKSEDCGVSLWSHFL